MTLVLSIDVDAFEDNVALAGRDSEIGSFVGLLLCCSYCDEDSVPFVDDAGDCVENDNSFGLLAGSYFGESEEEVEGEGADWEVVLILETFPSCAKMPYRG